MSEVSRNFVLPSVVFQTQETDQFIRHFAVGIPDGDKRISQMIGDYFADSQGYGHRLILKIRAHNEWGGVCFASSSQPMKGGGA